MTKMKFWSVAAATLGVSVAAQADVTDLTSKVSFTDWGGNGKQPSDCYVPNPTDPTQRIELAENYYDGTEAAERPLNQTISGLDHGYYVVTAYAHANAANGAQKGTAVTDGSTEVAQLRAYGYNKGNVFGKYNDESNNSTPIIANVSNSITKLRKYSAMVYVPKNRTLNTRYLEFGISVNDKTSTNWYVIQIASLKRYDNAYEATELYNVYTTAKANLENSTASSEAKSAYQTVIDAANTYMTGTITSVDAVTNNAAGMAEQITKLQEALKAYIQAGAKPTKGHQFDLTFMLTNADMADGTTGWTTTTTPNANYNEMEYYQQNFNVSQSISGLPMGRYTLKAQAFQRTADYNAAITDYNANAGDNTAYNVTAQIYAGNTAAAVKNFAADGQTLLTLTAQNNKVEVSGKTYANDMASASDFFDLGYYDNELSFTKADDSAINIGIKSDDNTGDKQWSIFSNFRLYMENVDTEVNISEDSETATLPEAGFGCADVTMTRKFAQGWNSVCVPVTTTASALKTTIGNPAKLAEFSGITTNDDNTLTLNFSEIADDATIAAGTSVMAKYDAAADAATYDFGLVSENAIALAPVAVTKGTKDGAVSVSFLGTYDKITDAAKEYAFAYIYGTGLYNYKQGASATLYPGRAVFYIQETGAEGVSVSSTNLDVNPTGINGISVAGEENAADGMVYDLQGRRVNNPSAAGVYIVNGKKVVMK